MNIRIITALILGIIAFGAGVYFLSGSMAESGPATKAFTLEIREGTLVTDGNLRVRQGDTVILAIVSDVAEEFHLHGYDRSVDLIPGQSVTLTFVANASGRFVFELEKTKRELGSIEVEP